MRLTARTALVPVLLATVAGLAACGTDEPAPAGGADDLSGTLTVLAAASLTESFETLATEFESQHEGATVELAFDSSATLAEQVKQGAPGDVLATADERTMSEVVDAGSAAGDPHVFATNRLVLVVPQDNPAGIRNFADIDRAGVDYVVCVESAPCGALAADVLDEQGIAAQPASEEVDVKAVLSKVALDEADAGLVYASDAVAAGDDVTPVEIPAADRTADRATTAYPIAVTADATEPDLAEAWVDLVLSEEGQQVLEAAGFGAP